MVGCVYIYTYIHTCTRAADNIACNTLTPSGLPKSDSHTPVLLSAAHRGLANLWFILEDMRGSLPFPAKSKETTHDFSMTSRVTAALPVRGGVAQEASGRHGDVLGLPGDVFRTPKGRNFEHRCLTWGLVKKNECPSFPKGVLLRETSANYDRWLSHRTPRIGGVLEIDWKAESGFCLNHLQRFFVKEPIQSSCD